MNIPEKESPPTEDELERALRYACEQRAYSDDDPREESHAQAAARLFAAAWPADPAWLAPALRGICAAHVASNDAHTPRLAGSPPSWVGRAKRVEDWYRCCLDIARIQWGMEGDRWVVTDAGKRFLLHQRFATPDWGVAPPADSKDW